jgi:amylosucrase
MARTAKRVNSSKKKNNEKKTNTANNDNIFNERFERHAHELEEKYHELYKDDEGFEELKSLLRAYYNERSAELKELDAQREKNPYWFRDGKMLGMTMYPKLFAGGLKGLLEKEKLDYLSEQKLTYLHLMPLLKMPHPLNDGGYAVEDFKTVDPTIGTNADLIKLTSELRKRGISLCLDVVMNHTADTHEWAMRAKAGEQEYMDRYMCYENYDIPARFESTMPQVFPTTAPGNFTWCEEMKRHVLTTFYPYQWDLNYRNPVVFREMAGNILYLANMGVEVFRIDAVPYIWKELDTNCRNLPQVHTIVRMIRMITEIVCPAVILKGEVVMAPKELPAYFGSEQQPECHMLYGVSSMVNLWSALASRDTRLLKHQMDVIHSLPDNCFFVNYLRCHDDIGWGLDEDEERRLQIDPLKHKEYLYHFYEGQFPGSFARGVLYNYDPNTKDARSCATTASLCGIEKGGFEQDETQVQQGIDRVLLMHAACMSLEGFVMLSSGDEIGQVNDYTYKENPDTADDSRYIHRSVFNWENAGKRHEKGTVQQRIWDGLQNLEEKRRNHECFRNDTYVTTWDTDNIGIFAIRRTNSEGEMLCLSNFTERTEVARLRALEGKKYRDIFTGDIIEPYYITLAPYQYRWCELITE